MLVTDDVDAALLKAFRKAAAAEGALVELIAPHIGGFVTSDGELIPAHQKVDGGPSVLYDAVVLLMSAEGAALLAADAAAKDFVTDAHAHCKFIAYTPDAVALLDAAGVVAELDDGYIELDRRAAITTFVEALSRRPLLGPHPLRRPGLTARRHPNGHQPRPRRLDTRPCPEPHTAPTRANADARQARTWRAAGRARAAATQTGLELTAAEASTSGSPTPTPTARYPTSRSCASSPTPASAPTPRSR